MLAAIDECRLSVTGLAIGSDAKEKNCITRADRPIGKEHHYHEVCDVYGSFAWLIVGMSK